MEVKGGGPAATGTHPRVPMLAWTTDKCLGMDDDMKSAPENHDEYSGARRQVLSDTLGQ